MTTPPLPKEDRATPGPWEWMFNSTGGQWVLVHRRGPYECDYVQTGGWPDAPLSADKRLIAAAPELLAVARMVPMLRRLGGMMHGSREVALAIVEAADAAIAKATGATP